MKKKIKVQQIYLCLLLCDDEQPLVLLLEPGLEVGHLLHLGVPGGAHAVDEGLDVGDAGAGLADVVGQVLHLLALELKFTFEYQILLMKFISPTMVSSSLLAFSCLALSWMSLFSSFCLCSSSSFLRVSSHSRRRCLSSSALK